MTQYQKYEAEKRKIASQNLPNKEYEKAIKELCKKLRMWGNN